MSRVWVLLLMREYEEPVIECQSCGKVLKTLSPTEAKAVAYSPNNYIMFCVLCKEEGLHIEPAFR